MRLGLGAGRRASAMCFALRRKCQYEQLPGGLGAVSAGDGAEAGPVRNLKERWGVGTEGIREYSSGVFGKAAKPFFYKRNFDVIIKCINRQLRTR